jgi:hypothetical protein
MAGRHKNPEDRKSYQLRVPLTAGQRAIIEEAIKLDLDEKAGWARAILLSAAKRTIAQNNEEMSKSPQRCHSGCSNARAATQLSE